MRFFVLLGALGVTLNGITLTWDMPSPAPGYRIHYISGVNLFTGYSDTTRYTIPETVLGRSYKVYVVATNSAGKESLPSRISTFTNKSAN